MVTTSAGHILINSNLEAGVPLIRASVEQLGFRFEEIRVLLDAGFVTTQDLDACTAPTSNRNCSDYVLATPDLEVGPVAVLATDLSDHRPLVTTIAVARTT